MTPIRSSSDGEKKKGGKLPRKIKRETRRRKRELEKKSVGEKRHGHGGASKSEEGVTEKRKNRRGSMETNRILVRLEEEVEALN